MEQTEQQQTTGAIRALFDSHFSGTIERSDGTSYPFSFDAIRFADDVNIAIEREEHIYAGGGATRIAQLHVLDDRSGWVGGKVSIYPPEMGSTFDAESGEYRYVVRPASISVSTHSAKDMVATRAFIAMLKLAVDYADALTLEMTPQIETQIVEQVERDRISERKRQAEEQRRANVKSLLAATAGGRPVRVTTVNGSLLSGELVTDHFYGANVEVGGKRVDVDTIFCVEVKQANGRYQTRLAPGWNAKVPS